MKGKINKKIIILLAIIVLITVIAGVTATFALFTNSDSGNVQIFTTGNLKITYDKSGSQISDAVFVPTTEDYAQIHSFTVTNEGNIPAKYKIDFTALSLTKNGSATTSANLKWKLYQARIDGNNEYQIDDRDIHHGLVASGDFSTYTTNMLTGNSLAIASDILLAASDTEENSHSYILKLWLNETNTNQSSDQGMIFSAKVKVTASQQ